MQEMRSSKFYENVQAVRSLIRSLFNEAMAPFQPENVQPVKGISFREAVTRFEKLLIETTLEITAGSQRKAAKLLDLSPTTLNAKIKRHKIAVNGRFI